MAPLRGFIPYTTDQGINVSIKAGIATATANGATLTKYPPVGVAWPYGYRNLRHVYGIDPSGREFRMTWCDPTTYSALVPGTSTFKDTAGNDCTISALIGEKTLFKYVS